MKMGTFFNCNTCGVIFRDQKTFLGATAEKSRYDKHKNDVTDIGFQKSVQPLVDSVIQYFSNEAKGLDYGCGNGPVATTILEKKGYEIALYDPFYAPDKKVLERKYDFIICNEVIEHFYQPKEEFKKLAALLKPNGKLICGTAICYPTIDFDNWFYKNDPTHVIFYTTTSLDLIKIENGFTKVSLVNNLAVFWK